MPQQNALQLGIIFVQGGQASVAPKEARTTAKLQKALFLVLALVFSNVHQAPLLSPTPHFALP